MTKKAKNSLLILVWSIVAVQMYVNYQGSVNGSEQVVTAFSVVDDKVVGEVVEGYGYFDTMELSDEVKKNMLENLALKMGITDGYTFSEGRGDGFTKYVLTKEGKYATTILQVISLLGKDEPEQYITMKITTAENVDKAFGLYEKVKRIYEEIGVEGQVSLEVEMEQQGNVLETPDKNLEKEILSLAKAETVDTIRENDIYTVYGYTKLEDSYLVLNDEKVNIQLVMTYDEAQDKTYIKAGLPIVNSSY